VATGTWSGAETTFEVTIVLTGCALLPCCRLVTIQVEVEIGKDPRITAISYVVDGVQAECWEWKGTSSLCHQKVSVRTLTASQQHPALVWEASSRHAEHVSWTRREQREG